MGLVWRGIVHDMSKFMPSEFIPYAKHFYGNKGSINKGRDASGYYRAGDTGNSAFDFAWLLHQKRNKHHWQWWALPMDSGKIKFIPMPIVYIKEMIADWQGAGMAISGRKHWQPWYRANKQNIYVHPETRVRIEYYLREGAILEK